MEARRHMGWRAWLRRIAWLILIWALSIAAVWLLAWALRLLMGQAGMRSAVQAPQFTPPATNAQYLGRQKRAAPTEGA